MLFLVLIYAAILIVSHKEHVQPGGIVFLELVEVGLGLLGLASLVGLWRGKHIDSMCEHCSVQTVILKLICHYRQLCLQFI